MKPLVFAVSAIALSFHFGTAQAGATRVTQAVWANNQLYGTVLTPTTFVSPPAQSTDTLYNFSMSGLVGQRSISDAAPADTAFNGGRWSVKMVVFTPQGISVHDPDGDGTINMELMNAAQVLEQESMGYVEVLDTTIYFECPLLP